MTAVIKPPDFVKSKFDLLKSKFIGSGNKKARDFCLGLKATFYCFLFNDIVTKPDGWVKYDGYDDVGYWPG